jgi:hypothetical protein
MRGFQRGNFSAAQVIATHLILAGGSSPARQLGSESTDQTRHC